jgi:hypothetical protein
MGAGRITANTFHHLGGRSMNVRTFFLVCVFLVSTGPAARAQVVVSGPRGTEAPRESVFGIGLFAGSASGIGLSFRHHLPGAFSYQVTGGVIKTGENLHYDIAGSVQYDFSRGESSRFYGTAGVGYYYSGESDNNTLEGPARAALGVGGEFHLVDTIHFMVEGVFTYFTDGTILPLPQVGAYYYFR